MSQILPSPTERFSGRVDNYVRYRPGYPHAVLDVLAAECGLAPGDVIADVGSGTGLLARLFLDNGNRVLGVEPNREMREAGRRLLAGYPAFTSVAATAEATTLAANSVDFVVAGQAFHWFDAAAAGREFRRILRPGGWIALVWNERQVDSTPFLRAYEQLLRTHAVDYPRISHRRLDEATMEDVVGFTAKVRRFDNRQVFDFEGLRGRTLSSSYAPIAGQPGHQAMVEALDALFRRYQVDGHVTLLYSTTVYFGRPAPSTA